MGQANFTRKIIGGTGQAVERAPQPIVEVLNVGATSVTFQFTNPDQNNPLFVIYAVEELVQSGTEGIKITFLDEGQVGPGATSGPLTIDGLDPVTTYNGFVVGGQFGKEFSEVYQESFTTGIAYLDGDELSDDFTFINYSGYSETQYNRSSWTIDYEVNFDSLSGVQACGLDGGSGLVGMRVGIINGDIYTEKGTASNTYTVPGGLETGHWYRISRRGNSVKVWDQETNPPTELLFESATTGQKSGSAVGRPGIHAAVQVTSVGNVEAYNLVDGKIRNYYFGYTDENHDRIPYDGGITTRFTYPLDEASGDTVSNIEGNFAIPINGLDWEEL